MRIERSRGERFDPRVFKFLRTEFRTALSLPFSALLWNARLAAARSAGLKVLIHSVDGPGYLPFAVPTWECLARSERRAEIAFYVAARPSEQREVAESVRGGLLPCRGVIPSWTCAALLAYDLFLTTHQSSAVPLVRRSPRLCTFHGLPAKGGTFVPGEWRHLDGAFLHGPLQRRLFEELESSEGEKVGRWSRDVGYPKSDALVRGEYRRADTLSRLGLDPDSQTVLYAPSWEDGGALRHWGMKVVECLLDVGVQLIVKLHPMSYYPPTNTHATGGVDWTAELDAFREGRAGFVHVRGGDVAPLVAGCDLLVTDVSSVAYEAFLVDRPVVFLDVPRFFEVTVGQMYGIGPDEARSDLRYNCGRQAGQVVADPPALGEAVRRGLSNPAEMAVERRDLRDQLIFNPGEGAEHTARAILEVLGL